MSLPDARAIAAAAVLVASAALGFGARAMLLRRLQTLARRTEGRVDDELLAALGRPLPLWFVLGGLYVASRLAEVPSDWTAAADAVLASLLVISLSLCAADLAVRLLAVGLRRRGGDTATATAVLQNTVRFSVLGVGALVLLNTLGVSVAPILTTMGIGGIAVALGLQDTLANLFAGVHMTLAGNVRMGDFVKLETGDEGYVENIRWRSTSVRTLPNNVVVVPNSRLAQSVVTNYHLPTKDLAVLVEVGVHYASDLERVERVTCEIARATLKSAPGGVSSFEPFIRYHDFGPHSIDFTVILRAQEFTDAYLVKHEFIKALSRRFAQEGIVIPYPIRAINLDQEGAVVRALASK